MIIDDRQGFAGFGAASGHDENDAWHKWCESNAAKDYGGSKEICRIGCCGSGWKVAGSAPWTFIGRQARFTVQWGIPNPAEYDPENLYVICQTDPARAAWLLAFAGAVSFPISGGLAGVAYVGAFMNTPVNPFGIAAFANIVLPLIGVRAALNNQSFFDRLWQKVVQPVFKGNWDQLMSLLTLGPTPAAALQIMLRKEAERSNPAHSPDVKAFLLALAENADFLASLKNGPNALREEWAIKKIGTVVRDTIAPKIQGSAGYVVSKLGRALVVHGKPISLMLNGKGVEALDEFSYNIFGVHWLPLYNGVKTTRDEAKRHLADEKITSDEALQLLKLVQEGMEALQQALSSVQWANLAKIVSDGLNVFTAAVQGKITTIEQLRAELEKTTPPPATTHPATSATKPVSQMTTAEKLAALKQQGTGGLSTKPASNTLVPFAPPTPPAPASKGPSLLGVVAAAGTGAAVGGAPGALIAGAAMWLLPRKK